MGAPQVTIETITVTRPLKVIAFTCCFITVILMTAATSTSDWMVAEGWREGLFAKCVDELAPLPLPFDIPEEEGCSKARAVSYIRGTAALVIIGLLFDFFGTLLTGLGLRSTDPNKKYKYYRVAIYALVVALIALTLAAIIYPVKFSSDLANEPEKNGRVLEPISYKGSLDFDKDGILDVVDPDDDNDGLEDEEDPDDDNDGILDEADDDDDNDGVPDDEDNDEEDFDGDGIPNDEDEDDDGDGENDESDEDDDNDGIPDSVDRDDDNDGIPDVFEEDTDGDGEPDAIDEDDGIDDEEDDEDQDNDGVPDDEDEDDDNDGVDDDEDNDDDNDGVPDDEDNDDDNDGVPDDEEDDDANDNDTDDDGLSDDVDGDDDNDGIPDDEDEDDDNDGIDDEDEGGPRTYEFGFGYGATWGSIILIFASVVLLICDRESEEIFYKERQIEDEEEGEEEA